MQHYQRIYKTTKRLKQGKSRLRQPFRAMSDWIESEFKVSVLNVTYKSPTKYRKPQIQVVVETEKDVEVFYSGINSDESKRNKVTGHFCQIVAANDNYKFETDRLLVTCSAFVPAARHEVHGLIPQESIDALAEQIGNPDIWLIRRFFVDCITFFFYTDDQVAQYISEGLKREYGDLYFRLLKPFDEFSYISRDGFKVHFDSKQNFDENFDSNWMYYLR
ncbi:hypothetical protein [Calycomorphotria hydatis]|uniref:Uncharacterized protein n=1 Tax=Calycomorphotria hydatis TaxID=2528027 RepID=A0A517TCY7_9PLAN|nr:hypothetical protein [Calycomorphotria hydatis]QDT66243.1 hypothetical protein V22_35080 [Calycomorphotria hydatis]